MRRLALPLALLVLSMPSLADQNRPLLWQTNSGGDDVHVIDAESGTRRALILVGQEPHGLAATADGRTIFVTAEASGLALGDLLWIDAASFKLMRRTPVCREPHALAATPDGRWLYVPCRDGHYRIVNGRSGGEVGSIATGGRPHNTQIARDGRMAFLSPMGGSNDAFVVDIAGGHRLAGRIRFRSSLRPSALSADGRYLVQQVDGLNGFQVADVARQLVIATVEHSTPLEGARLPFLEHLGRLSLDGFERCHGLGIRPGQREIWSVCSDRVSVHELAEPGFRELAAVPLPAKGYWITFSPDGARAFVALSDTGRVAAIDADGKRVLKLIDAGVGPKRNLVLPSPK
jgi:DNA-binding beta-propeller fold protein YncE